LADLLESVVGELQIIAKRAKLTLGYDKMILPIIKMDENKLRQVFINVIDNAIKYTPEGGIVVKTLLDEDHITITIKDTGIGMKKEDIASIYEKFQRGKTGLDIYPNGTGIGLYIANEVIKAHGGRIWAESKGINTGTTFYIEIPLG